MHKSSRDSSVRVLENASKHREKSRTESKPTMLSSCRAGKLPDEPSELGDSVRGTEAHCPILLDESSTEEEPPSRPLFRAPAEERKRPSAEPSHRKSLAAGRSSNQHHSSYNSHSPHASSRPQYNSQHGQNTHRMPDTPRMPSQSNENNNARSA